MKTNSLNLNSNICLSENILNIGTRKLYKSSILSYAAKFSDRWRSINFELCDWFIQLVKPIKVDHQNTTLLSEFGDFEESIFMCKITQLGLVMRTGALMFWWSSSRCFRVILVVMTFLKNLIVISLVWER